MGRFRLARAAADDVAAIFVDGLDRFGLPQADRCHDALEATFAFLGDVSHAARLRVDIEPAVRAYPSSHTWLSTRSNAMARS